MAVLGKLFTVAALAGVASSMMVGKNGEKVPYHQGKSPNPRAIPHNVFVFSGTSQSGNYYNFNDYVPDLNSYGFDNTASSMDVTGVWLFYDYSYYNDADFSAPAVWRWGESYTDNFPSAFDNKLTSLRYGGAPDDYKADVLNMYEGEYFAGNEQYFYSDAAYLNQDNFGASLLVTGCSPWTVYSLNNYQGASLCFYPSDTSNCYPGFLEVFPSEIEFWVNEISSVRKGCYSKNVHKMNTVPAGELQRKPEA